MAVIGPSGEKTELILAMLSGNVLSQIRKICFVTVVQEAAQKLPLSFKKKPVRLQNIENCLLIFDDSCEELFNDTVFVMLATAGGHKNKQYLCEKHGLYQQSKWSRIELNRTYAILFNSPRNTQQVDYLGKQLKLVVTSGPESSLKHETNSRGSNGAKIIALRVAVRLGFCNFHFLWMQKLGYFGVSQFKLKGFELDVLL